MKATRLQESASWVAPLSEPTAKAKLQGQKTHHGCLGWGGAGSMGAQGDFGGGGGGGGDRVFSILTVVGL